MSGYMNEAVTVEWATPADLFRQLDEEFHFTLDPCSTDANAKCEKHYTIETDGLTQNWGGRKCSAILHMAEGWASGWRSATRNRRNPIPCA